MCQSPSSSVVARAIALKYASAQRAAALRWLLANGALLAVLLLDLWKWCGEWWCYGLWTECALAGALAASCARHAARLAGPRASATPAPLSPRQQALLGLSDDDLDGSFVVSGRRAEACAASPPAADAEEPGSLSPPRARWWRAGGDSPPPSPPAPSPPARRSERAEPAEFISDASALAAYVRQQEARASGAGPAGAGGARALPPPARAHQLSVLPDRGAKEGAAEEEGGGGAGAGLAGAGAAPLWRRLQLDPQRLTEYNLNLRLWLHVSVVGRVARELAAWEAGAGAGVGGLAALPPDHTLARFLRPFADRQYVADRIKELSRGGCLSAYRWNGGGRGWAAGGAGRPADAELLLHLLATYLDLLVPGGDFSARHLSGAGGAGAGAGPRALALHRAAAHPPHYVLLLGEETIELPGGRNNLLHTLLLFLAALARGAPPALCRLHLGPAGLNMLWILGR